MKKHNFLNPQPNTNLRSDSGFSYLVGDWFHLWYLLARLYYRFNDDTEEYDKLDDNQGTPENPGEEEEWEEVPSAARTESGQNVCNKCLFWTSCEAFQIEYFALWKLGSFC